KHGLAGLVKSGQIFRVAVLPCLAGRVQGAQQTFHGRGLAKPDHTRLLSLPLYPLSPCHARRRQLDSLCRPSHRSRAMIHRFLLLLAAGMTPAAENASVTPAAPARVSPLFRAPPHRPVLPRVKNSQKAINPVDAFILAGLEAKGLTLSPRAGRL